MTTSSQPSHDVTDYALAACADSERSVRIMEKIPKTRSNGSSSLSFIPSRNARRHGESLSSQSSMTPVSRRGRSPVFIAASRMHMLAIGPCNALSRTTNGSTIWLKSTSDFPRAVGPTADHRGRFVHSMSNFIRMPSSQQHCAAKRRAGSASVSLFPAPWRRTPAAWSTTRRSRCADRRWARKLSARAHFGLARAVPCFRVRMIRRWSILNRFYLQTGACST